MKKSSRLTSLILTTLLVGYTTVYEDIKSDGKDTDVKTESSIEVKAKSDEGSTDANTLNETKYTFFASNIKGSTFIKSVKLDNNYSNIEFYMDYIDYRISKGGTALTESDYLDYFGTGDNLNKIMFMENIWLLSMFPELEGVKMTIPYVGKVYSLDVDRETVNNFLGIKVEDLSMGDGSWQEFDNMMKNDDSKRAEFVDKFVKVLF